MTYISLQGKQEKSGIGLTVVHGTVTNHYGNITVECKLGKGATFPFFRRLGERLRLKLKLSIDDRCEFVEKVDGNSFESKDLKDHFEYAENIS